MQGESSSKIDIAIQIEHQFQGLDQTSVFAQKLICLQVSALLLLDIKHFCTTCDIYCTFAENIAYRKKQHWKDFYCTCSIYPNNHPQNVGTLMKAEQWVLESQLGIFVALLLTLQVADGTVTDFCNIEKLFTESSCCPYSVFCECDDYPVTEFFNIEKVSKECSLLLQLFSFRQSG